MKPENQKTGGGLANLANLANFTLERSRQAAKRPDRGTANTAERNLTSVTAVGHLGKSGNFRSSDSRQQCTTDTQRRTMTATDEKAIRAWLAHIEETDPLEIQSLLDECQRDPEARLYFLGRAAEVRK